ncbi:MAG TPA: type III pantothenate kinase [Oscillospiraceae bacterium]|nr:type III pantothenate kinase [Oscillospiraceae bacterium]
MFLAIDIGNTTMEFGIYDGEKLAAVFRLGTKRDITSDEVGLFTGQFFEMQHIPLAAVTDAAIGSVVPQVNYTVSSAVIKYFGIAPKVIGESLPCPIPNLYDHPSEVGMDRLVDAYAAYRKYGGPLVIVDFGTATCCDAVSAKGEFLGGVIHPGLKVSMDALFEKAAKLPRVELCDPEVPYGKNTVQSMQAGAYYGYLGAVERLTANIKAALGPETKVVATGGLSRLFENSGLFDIVDCRLPLDGIRLTCEAAKQTLL